MKDFAEGNGIIIAGDFNAPHQAWGYGHNTRKGNDLVETVERESLTMIMKCCFPATRLGNSVCRDTFPDLAFTTNLAATEWANMNLNFGSDHYLL